MTAAIRSGESQGAFKQTPPSLNSLMGGRPTGAAPTHPKYKLIRSLWKAGLSTRQIAKSAGLGKTYVHELCAKSGLSRTQQQAAIIRQPSTSNHWRSARAAARKIMERYLGRKLETWEHVHHIDEDYTNRALDNLEVLTEEAHYDLHWPDRKVPYERRLHVRKYRKGYRDNVAKARKLQGVSIK